MASQTHKSDRTASVNAIATRRPAAIESRKLTLAFGIHTVLDEVDFEISAGQTVAIVGANGAGKTTLLRCLAGVLRPQSGEVLWLGQPSHKNASSRRQVGMVAHQRLFYPELTPRENLLFAARMYGVRDPQQRVTQLLSDAGLNTWADQPTARLSHGMRQRLAVSRALVHDPPILLLDEPFSGLDADARNWLTDRLAELCDRGATICFTTHDGQSAWQLADRILLVEDCEVRELNDGNDETSTDDLDWAKVA
jgi:heme exporter protein A